MYEVEKENLRRYAQYVTNILRPSYIRSFMNDYLDAECVERILSEEKSSVTSSVKMLLDQVVQLQQEGWFQAFVDILLASGYTGLHAAVTSWDFSQLESLQPHRRILELVEPSITKNMKPRELLPHLNECLMQRECQEINAVEEQRGSVAASERLLESLKRCDKTQWFKVLKLALETCSQMLALKSLDPGDNCKVETMEEVEDGDTMATVCIQYCDGGQSDMDLTSANEMISINQEGENEGARAAGFEKSQDISLREYQKELAAAAFEGQNTIVCAPTGCGKTIVAKAICEHHLKRFPEKAKVVFMATKVDVFEQQLKLFRKHFSKDQSVRVEGVCGSMELSLSTVLQDNEVVVLTPQILVNALQRGEMASLEVFTLLLLDECHNTTGKHPYNNIMSRYLDAKLNGNMRALPQVVGFTASVGIGTFRNQIEAENNICQLCANLDARMISTVSTHVDELRSYVHIPEKEFYGVELRPSDPFIRIITNIMSDIEMLAKSVYNIDSLSQISSREFGSQKYEQWIVEVQKNCKLLRIKEPEEERRVCRALFNYTEHLRKYNDALMINEDARTKDALSYLQLFISQVRNAGFDETEQQLTAFFEDQQEQLQRLASDGQENPKLQDLKFILGEEYHNNPQTRTVLFVRTRALADALKNWIEETDSLKFLKPGVLIGRGRKSQLTDTGMTLTSQKGVLDSFKSSDQSKILIATSVADEGIDIPQCNLVIMYEYVGNVVKMVQVRGRGRAQGSRCYLISSRKERIDKEKQNMVKEKLVEKAIVALQASPEDLHIKVDVFQREDKAKRDHLNSSPARPRTQDSFKLLCAKCRNFMCHSDDLRVLQEAHHIILDRSVFERCDVRPHGRPKTFDGVTKKEKMLCKNCKHDWGIIASYLNIQDLPLLKVESFVAENPRTQRLHHFRKWCDITFTIHKFDLTEMSADVWGPRNM